MKKRKRKLPKILKNNEPELTTVCTPVAEGEDISEDIRNLLYALLNSKNCVGLSANQIGITKRIIAVKIGNGYRIFVNPEVFVPDHAILCPGIEGCLSYPGVIKQVNRWNLIGVAFQNEDGEKFDDSYTGQFARVVQHEADHLNGRCILDSNDERTEDKKFTEEG